MGGASASSIELAHTTVGIIGNITSFGLYLAPIPTFIQIIRWRSTKEFSGIPYLATLLNGLLWVLYGIPVIHPNSMLVATVNIAGAIVEIVYIAIFIHYANKKNRLKQIYLLLAMVLSLSIIVALTLLLAHTYELRTLIVGCICVAVGILMYGAPLTIMGQVICTKSVEYMPFHLSFASFMNALVWATYAILKFDIFIIITNGAGVILTSLQFVLYALYCGNKSSTSELKMPTVIENNTKDKQETRSMLDLPKISKNQVASNELLISTVV